MKITRFMPLRYWVLLVLFITVDLYYYFVHGESLKSKIATIVILVIFGFLARDDAPKRS